MRLKFARGWASVASKKGKPLLEEQLPPSDSASDGDGSTSDGGEPQTVGHPQVEEAAHEGREGEEAEAEAAAMTPPVVPVPVPEVQDSSKEVTNERRGRRSQRHKGEQEEAEEQWVRRSVVPSMVSRSASELGMSAHEAVLSRSPRSSTGAFPYHP